MLQAPFRSLLFAPVFATGVGFFAKKSQQTGDMFFCGGKRVEYLRKTKDDDFVMFIFFRSLSRPWLLPAIFIDSMVVVKPTNDIATKKGHAQNYPPEV